MENKEKTRKINELNAKTMVGNIGIEIIEVGKNFVSGRMPVDKRTTQPYGLLHGGASVAFAESLGSLAGSFHIDWKKEAVVGIEINASHLKSVRSGWVYGRATPVKIGKRIQVWNINITNEDKEAVCISRLTLAVVKSEEFNNSFKKE
jgi:1,4-dihydroxy-2-naphthoyl-CoA hydrolase|tara:strand:+ start:248 stop:691 length:444 start_codon:yes stop_codon:yes gene_type:complete